MNASHLSFRTHLVKSLSRRKQLTFGDFVADAYRALGGRRANGFIQLALKAHIVHFRGRKRFVLS